MVYYHKWHSFQYACYKLIEEEPVKARWSVRYRHQDKLLVLKLTDDKQCIKFKTRSSIFLNRFEQLQQTISLLYHQIPKTQPEPVPIKIPTNEVADSVPQSASGTTTPAVAAGETGAAAKKKKKGKKKK